MNITETTDIMNMVKLGATQEITALTKLAAMNSGLKVACGNASYRIFQTNVCGGLYATVAAAIRAAYCSPYDGECPDPMMRIEPLESWEVAT